MICLILISYPLVVLRLIRRICNMILPIISRKLRSVYKAYMQEGQLHNATLIIWAINDLEYIAEICGCNHFKYIWLTRISFYDFSFKFTIKNSTFQISNPTFKNLCVIFHDQKDYYDTPLNCITQVHIWVKTTLYQNTRRKCKLYNFWSTFFKNTNCIVG